VAIDHDKSEGLQVDAVYESYINLRNSVGGVYSA